jgi:type II secretory pathway predicted ATPase ExeA
MNRSPFPFRDFVRAKDNLVEALVEHGETYAMLTGETGTGKTALLRDLKSQIDRTRHRVLYFSEAKKLGAAGLVKVVGEALRVRTSMCHSVSLDRLLRTLSEESHTILLWLDEAQDLPEETLAEVRALAESDLDGTCRVQILLVGLPRLRAELQTYQYLWRRIVVREEITGLVMDEMQDFLTHHFEAGQSKRLCDQGLSILFERAGGAPGLLLPMYRTVLRRAGAGKGKIDPEQVEEALERWELA